MGVCRGYEERVRSRGRWDADGGGSIQTDGVVREKC